MEALPYYLLIGAIAGILSGLFGIGGGIIVVTGLVWVFDHFQVTTHAQIHLATGSSLASIVFIALSASLAHYHRNTIVWPLFRRLFPGLVMGSILGASLSQYLPGSLLKVIFGCFLLTIAYRMAFSSSHAKKKIKNHRFKSLSWLSGLVGLQAGLLGIGTGSMLIPFFTRCHLRMRQAAGTAITCSVPVGIIGTLTLILTTGDRVPELAWATGYVYWPATLSIATTSLVFAPVGVNLAKRWSNAKLKQLFSVILFLMGGEMIWPNLSHFLMSLMN